MTLSTTMLFMSRGEWYQANLLKSTMISLAFIFIEIRSSTSLLKADSSLFAIRPTTVVTSANLMIHIIRREGGGAGFIVVG